jgi:hypothetical protein
MVVWWESSILINTSLKAYLVVMSYPVVDSQDVLAFHFEWIIDLFLYKRPFCVPCLFLLLVK